MRTHSFWPPAFAALLLISAAWAELPPVSSRAQNGPAPSARDWGQRHTPVVEVVKRVKHSVVNIHSERTVRAAIHGGARSVAEVERACGAGSGCGACRPDVASLIEAERGVACPDCPARTGGVLSPYLAASGEAA